MGTTENSFLFNELPSLNASGIGTDALTRDDEAMHVLNADRKHRTVLYPGVLEPLISVKSNGAQLVAYTESLAYWAE